MATKSELSSVLPETATGESCKQIHALAEQTAKNGDLSDVRHAVRLINELHGVRLPEKAWLRMAIFSCYIHKRAEIGDPIYYGTIRVEPNQPKPILIKHGYMDARYLDGTPHYDGASQSFAELGWSNSKPTEITQRINKRDLFNRDFDQVRANLSKSDRDVYFIRRKFKEREIEWTARVLSKERDMQGREYLTVQALPLVTEFQSSFLEFTPSQYFAPGELSPVYEMPTTITCPVKEIKALTVPSKKIPVVKFPEWFLSFTT